MIFMKHRHFLNNYAYLASYDDGVVLTSSISNFCTGLHRFHRNRSKLSRVLFVASGQNRHLHLSRLIKRHARAHTAKPLRYCRAGIYPPCFSSKVPFIRSHLTMAERDAAETTSTRWRCPEAPVPPSRPGSFS